METSGPDAEVSKVLPPLTIDDDQLEQGLAIVADAVAAVAAAAPARELAAVGGERGGSL
jgi:diaminobutyrate-2-oxoglutarate transaminase